MLSPLLVIAGSTVVGTATPDPGDSYGPQPGLSHGSVRVPQPVEISASQPGRGGPSVVLRTDEPERCRPLRERLLREGLTDVRICADTGIGSDSNFVVSSSEVWICSGWTIRVMETVQAFLVGERLPELARRILARVALTPAEIEVQLAFEPTRAHAQQASCQKVARVLVRSDDIACARELLIPRLEPFTRSIVFEDRTSELLRGCVVGFAAGLSRHQEASFLSALHSARTVCGTHPALALHEVRLASPTQDGEAVRIDFPILRCTDPAVLQELRSYIPDFHVKIQHVASRQSNALIREIQTLGYQVVEIQEGEAQPGITMHDACPDLLMPLVARVLERTGHRLEITELDPLEPDLILVRLPGWFGDAVSPQTESLAQWDDESLGAWVAPTRTDLAAAAEQEFVEDLGDRVRIADLILEKHPDAGPNAQPAPADLAPLCYDGKTAHTLLHLGEAYSLRRPAALLGSTSAGKTALVEHLATLVGARLERVLCKPDMSADELVGHYRPDGKGSLAWTAGPLVRALRDGAWLLLDELDLAPSAVLEILNHVLESPPRFQSHDAGGISFGPGGLPIHRCFWLVAARNGTSYEGRNPLSPALRNRLQNSRWVPEPGETEYAQMLRHLVFGGPHSVVVRGQSYRQSLQAEHFAALRKLPRLGAFLEALARFHAGLARADFTATEADAQLVQELPVFTRRNLLSVLEWLLAGVERSAGVGLCAAEAQRTYRVALHRYYLEPVAAGQRSAIVALLDANGIGPGCWRI